jgi:hypothetical protein
MQAKLFEVRDRLTFIAVLAVRLEPGGEADRYLLARCGFGRDPDVQRGYVMMTALSSSLSSSSPDDWMAGGRTLRTAHRYIRDHWEELASGDIVDVEFLAGEIPAPRPSEATLRPIPAPTPKGDAHAGPMPAPE